MSSLPAGLAGSDRSSGDGFITSSLDTINRPPSTLPSTPVPQHRERRRQSRRGSSSSRLTTVKTPQSRKRATLRCRNYRTRTAKKENQPSAVASDSGYAYTTTKTGSEFSKHGNNSSILSKLRVCSLLIRFFLWLCKYRRIVCPVLTTLMTIVQSNVQVSVRDGGQQQGLCWFMGFFKRHKNYGT
ncbi:hypothetical protein UY3_13902 [Chelonia mydas]|uniref:Uncharacterized protein n=1 Tax=Chelonia mydas TaxID=8469 RepID=M7B0R1_CHEMY|nr:hypothetical protein UY3_13902 [Chelonia mydas]